MSALSYTDVASRIADDRPVSLARKRELGAFYTPSTVTKVLCDWAIKSSDDLLLEPSFGGCTFLEASVKRIQELGSNTAKNIYGCDIDPEAFEILQGKDIELDSENFSLKNFLSMDPVEIPSSKVDAVIGNPPYVRYSKLNSEQRKAIHAWEDKYQLRLNRRASLWTYFSFHALHFLKEGGRMAWVLPVSFMTAQYASDLRELFFNSFEKLAFFTLTERVFLLEGTEERALIVLAEGFGKHREDAHITSRYVDTLPELCAEVERWSVHSHHESPGNSKSNFGLVSNEVERVVAALKEESDVVDLGSIADIGIGVVTGNSKFFIRSHKDWRANGIGLKHLSYILPKSRFVPGMEATALDKESHKELGVPCFALDASVDSKSKAVLGYLASYNVLERVNNATFAKRSCWFRFLDGRAPDAFFVFMTHNGPRIIINSVGANTTNGLYRVNFKSTSGASPKLIAISLQTTFTQLEAEKLGRPRGSGALKLEPCDAKGLPVYLPLKTEGEIAEAFALVDHYMRQGLEDSARAAADDFIFSCAPVFSRQLPLLESSLRTARKRRVRNKEASDE